MESQSKTRNEPLKPILSVQSAKSNFTETMFNARREKIEKLKQEHLEQSLLENKNEMKQYPNIIFNDQMMEKNENWEYATFNTVNSKEDVPKIASEWAESSVTTSLKGIETRNLIFKSKDIIDFYHNSLEVSVNIILKGDSIFWLVLRSDGDFDEYTAIIKLSKDEKSQRTYVSLGTFVLDESGKLVIKNFLKQQLIDYSRSRKNHYTDNDLVEVRLNVFDTGENKIFLKCLMNESKKENEVSGDFMLPSYRETRVVVAGSGHSCLVKHLKTRQKQAEKGVSKDIDASYLNEQKNCDCCGIY